MTYKILSLDGGGIRGILSARLMARLSEKAPGWTKRSDMIAGTSTGGILALALSFGLTPDDCVKLYAEGGERIFASRGFLSDDLILDEAWRANYDNEGLIDLLKENFGDTKIGELKQRVFVPTFDLEIWRPDFIDSTQDRWKELSVVDAALMTSAAPTYFPTKGKYVDGGVAANNPAGCALAAAHRDGFQNEDIVLMSIGTGFNPNSMEGGDHGYRTWLKHLIPLLMEGPQKAEEYKVRMQLNGQQFRLNPLLGRVIDLADYEASAELIAEADEEDLKKADAWLNEFWRSDFVGHEKPIGL